MLLNRTAKALRSKADEFLIIGRIGNVCKAKSNKATSNIKHEFNQLNTPNNANMLRKLTDSLNVKSTKAIKGAAAPSNYNIFTLTITHYLWRTFKETNSRYV